MSACAPKTGLLLQIEGPNGTTSVAAGVTALELVTASPSYCGRWVLDAATPSQTFSVENRDLTASPETILVTPDLETNLKQAIFPLTLAQDAAQAIVGFASIGQRAFSYEHVDEYTARTTLLASAPSDIASDGCICLPGQPWIGNGSGTGCDQRIPPSYARLVATQGCELPAGASLPLDTCDGQLYPGEVKDRAVPCFVSEGGACKIGQRTCIDTNGIGVDRVCAATTSSPSTPTSALCDAEATCDKTACSDPIVCLQKAIAHHSLSCTLPIAATADMGLAQPCAGGSWTTAIGRQTGAACVAAVLDGTQHDVFTVGLVDASPTVVTADLVSTACPPALRVEKIATMTPATLPAAIALALSLDDSIYDVTIRPIIGCENGVALSCTEGT